MNTETEPTDTSAYLVLWDELPEEILLSIFSFVPREHLNSVGLVNRRWRLLSHDKFTFDKKLSMNVAVLGPVHSGKTTIIVQTLLKTGTWTERDQLKVQKEAEKRGFTRTVLTWMMDKHNHERDRMITMEVHRARVELPQHFVTLIDTPGHIDYTRHTISGATQADHAMLVVSGNWKEFEAKIGRLHTLVELIMVSGLKQIIVAVSQLDNIGHQIEAETSFDLVKGTVLGIMKKYSIASTRAIFLPVSGESNLNIVTPAPEFSWFKGPTLLEALSELKMPRRMMHKPLRICIDRAYKIAGIGTVVVGTVIQGVVYSGQDVKIGPVGHVCKIRSLQLAIPKTPIEIGLPGDHVGMAITNLSLQDVGARRLGLVTSLIGEEEMAMLANRRKDVKHTWKKEAKSLQTLDLEQKARQQQGGMFPCKKFIAKLIIVDPLGVINVGYKTSLHCHNAQVPVKISRIQEIIRKGKPSVQKHSWKEKRSDLSKYDIALVEFEIEGRKLSIDTAARCPKLGRFILREAQQIVAAGLVLSADYSDYDF